MNLSSDVWLRAIPVAVFAILLITISWAAVRAHELRARMQDVATPSSTSPALEMPAGALLYLEARDFHSLLDQWNQSAEKREWLGSDNYAEFSRSRLFLRLQEAQEQFAAAAGIPPNMALLDQAAGTESALALYDIGDLQWLYISRQPASRIAESALWKLRGSYAPRMSAGMQYFVKSNGGRTMAFASAGDRLLLATREDLMAGALALIAGQQNRNIAGEEWFQRTTKQQTAQGDLRMVLNLRALVPSPYFRSYWVQRNITEMRQYGAGITDLHLGSTEFREERLLLRTNSDTNSGLPRAPSSRNGETISPSGLLSLLPPNTGVYQGWANPGAQPAIAKLEELLAPKTAQAPASQYAPGMIEAAAMAGSESDLETRIDMEPLRSSGTTSPAGTSAITELLKPMQLTGLLWAAAPAEMPDRVWVTHHRLLLLEAAGDWNADAVRAALQEHVAASVTASRLGASWVEDRAGQQSVYRLDGLAPLAMAASGHYLIVGNDAADVAAVLAKVNGKLNGRANGSRVSSQPNGAGAENGQVTYAAGFEHVHEQQAFARTTSLIDRTRGQTAQAGKVPDTQRPSFFSGNILSLSQALRRVESESIEVKDSGAEVRQTVRYRWASR